jgi:hypothetical protein
MPNLQGRHFTPSPAAGLLYATAGQTVYPADLVGLVINLITDPGAASVDIVLNAAVEFFFATVVKTNQAGGAGDTVTIQNGANAISDARILNVATTALHDLVPYAAGTTAWNTANASFAAGGTLRIARGWNTNNACIISLFGVPRVDTGTASLRRNLKNRHFARHVPTDDNYGSPMGLGALVFELANADTGNAGGIGDFIMGQAFQVVWVCVLKKAAAAVTTLTVTNATLGVAITDAISLNQADTMEVRPASIGVASAVSPRLAAGDTLRLTKSAANCACRVLVIGIPG